MKLIPIYQNRQIRHLSFKIFSKTFPTTIETEASGPTLGRFFFCGFGAQRLNSGRKEVMDHIVLFHDIVGALWPENKFCIGKGRFIHLHLNFEIIQRMPEPHRSGVFCLGRSWA